LPPSFFGQNQDKKKYKKRRKSKGDDKERGKMKGWQENTATVARNR
jgi:hypothetical protein